ncbi:hypothetical protein HYV84_06820 [Candidatus Woesearchaeota archaeon]|nr:hypothetical protein [Candidatus Woesearchaeota archaeon]
MADVEGYEIMPYKEVVELKNQIAELQQKVGDPNAKDLLVSMQNLTKTMDSMLKLFSAAAEEMKLEEKTESELHEKLSPLIEKVEKLEEQNRTIAEGMVAIADMVKEMRGGKPAEEKHDKPEEHDLFPDFNPSELPEMPSLDGTSNGAQGHPEPSPFGLGQSQRKESPPSLPDEFPIGGPPPLENMGPPPGFSSFGPPPQRPPFRQPSFPSGPSFQGMPPPPPGFLSPLPPLPPLDEPEEKKGLFGMFKKK